MGRLENALYIIQGEFNLLLTAMRRNTRWLSSNIHQVCVHIFANGMHGVCM